MRILVVDDERTLVKGIRYNLENEGYDVDCCYDGTEAVSMAKKTNYHLIILDLMMPGKDGLQVCQEIRTFSTVPVIMLTAKSERADLLLGFESGADDYITKPFDILELKARVRALLRRSSMNPDDGQNAVPEHIREHIRLNESQRSAWKDGTSRTPAKSTAASSSWIWSGDTTISAIPARSMCISAGSVKSWSGIRPHRS